MGNQTSQPILRQSSPESISQLVPAEMRDLYVLFTNTYPSNEMSLKDFENVFSKIFPFGRVENFCERLFKTINLEGRKYAVLEEVMLSFAILFNGSPYEKLRWIFRFYDIDNDGVINRKDIITGIQILNELLADSVHQEIEPETTASEIFNLKNDTDFITFGEFEQAVQANSNSLSKLSIFGN